MAVEEALSLIARFRPDALVVSLGVDGHVEDPICAFELTVDDFRACGGRIAAMGVPTLYVMEGGYAVERLGENVASVLEGHRAHDRRSV